MAMSLPLRGSGGKLDGRDARAIASKFGYQTSQRFSRKIANLNRKHYPVADW